MDSQRTKEINPKAVAAIKATLWNRVIAMNRVWSGHIWDIPYILNSEPMGLWLGCMEVIKEEICHVLTEVPFVDWSGKSRKKFGEKDLGFDLTQ